MEYISLKMKNTNLITPSELSLPDGYSIRLFTSGDEYHWSRIAYEAEEFNNMDEAMDYFEEHFGPHKAKLLDSCFFCCDVQGIPIGSATAWFGEADGIIQGMLHWVIISKAHQGKGLCRPLVIAALQKMKQKYSSAFLTTQTYSFKGIKIYLDEGFEPVEEGYDWRRGWQLVWEATHHPKLEKYSI